MMSTSTTPTSERNLRVLQVTGSTRVDYGGTSRSVPAICDALSAHQMDVHLVTGRTDGVKSNVPAFPVVTHLIDESPYFGCSFTGKTFSDQLALLHASAPQQCIVHDHGIWLPSNRAVARQARKNNWTRIVSPRGMVSKWGLSHGSRLQKLAWYLS